MNEMLGTNSATTWVDRENCVQYEIVPGSGPSMNDFHTALFNNKENIHRCPSEPIRLAFLAFKAPKHEQSIRHKFFIRLNDLGHEDGGDSSWMFHGYATRTAHWEYGGANAELKVEGYYNTRFKTGYLFVEGASTAEHSGSQPVPGDQPRIDIQRRSDQPQG